MNQTQKKQQSMDMTLRVHHKAPDHVRGSSRDRKPFSTAIQHCGQSRCWNFVGSHALAAVGSTTSIINMIVMFFTGTSVGAGVVISRYYGATMMKSFTLPWRPRWQ